MANGIKYQAHEILNKVLNAAETGLQVDIVAGAEYAEDAEHSSADTGNFVLGVRNDALAALGGTDGDYVPFQMNASGALYVEATSIGGYSEDVATPSTISGSAIMVERDDALGGLTPAEGDWASLRCDANGALWTRDDTLDAVILTDNAAAGATPKVLLTGAHYKDSVDTYADNDVSPLHVDANGRLIVGGASAHDIAVAGNPLLAGYEAKTLDGSALPNTVNAEGDIVRAASTLSGVAYNNLVVVDGSESAISEHDVAIGSGLGTAGVVNLYESKNQDASAFPNAVNAEGDMIRPAASLSGVQYIMPVSEDGSKTPMATDDSGQVATPEMLNVGGEYRSSVTTYANGDATILQSDVNGRLLVGGSAAEDAAIAGNPIPAGGRYDSSVRTLDNGDVGTLALDPTGALYTREYLGQAGSILVTGTTNAVTTGVSGTKFVAIQFLEDTTFDAGSEGLVASTAGLWPDDNNASATIDDNGGAVTGSEVFPQGMTIFGRWDGFKLDSGKVIGYLGYV